MLGLGHQRLQRTRFHRLSPAWPGMLGCIFHDLVGGAYCKTAGMLKAYKPIHWFGPSSDDHDLQQAYYKT